MEIKVDNELTLRTLELEDVEYRYEVINNNREFLKEWLGWVENIKDVNDLISYTNTCIEDLDLEVSYTFGIYCKDKFVGVISIKDIDNRNKKAEIGYWLSRDVNGRGIMIKSCKVIINFIYEKLKLNRIFILTATENFHSQAIPKKLKFEFEGTLRDNECLYGKYVDNYLFSMLKKDWDPNN